MKNLQLVLALVLLAPALASAQFIPERGKMFMGARYAELEQLVEKEIKDDPNPPSSKLLYLCVAYSKLKRYNKLAPCLDRLEDNVKRGDFAAIDLEEMKKGNPLLFGLAMMGSAAVGGPDGLKGDVRPFLPLMRAELYTELRDYDKAIAAAQQAFAAIPQRWNEERSFRIQALTALGLSHAFAGKKEEAEKYAETLTAVSTSYPYSGLTKDKVMGVAKIYIALGDYQKAYAGMRSDSSIMDTVFGTLGDVIGGTLVGMGGESIMTFQALPSRFMAVKTQFEVGEIKQAKEGYDALLAIPRVRDNGEIYWVLLYDRGRMAAGEGDLAGAVDLWKRSIEVIEQQRSTINTEANKIGFVGDKQAVYGRMIGALVELGRTAEAFDYVERAKSRALVDMLASKKDFAIQAMDPEKARRVLAQLDAEDISSRAQDGSAQLAETGSARTLHVARQEVHDTVPELSSLVSVTSIPASELKELLGEQEALVEYYYQDKDIYAFVATKTELKAVKLDAAGLVEEVQAFRTALEAVGKSTWQGPAQALYARLWQPLAPVLSAKTVIVVAHGALHYLPFAALQKPDGRFLIDEVSLRFLPSAAVLKFLKPTLAQQRGSLLVFGNPDLGDARLDLQFAQVEAQAVAKMFPDARLLIRKEASKANFNKSVGVFSRLHFATHGKFQADAPLSSGLYLAKNADNDGVLTVGELYSMNLNADLVTLSACETGLGKISNGDDVVGLTRGFLYAGSRSIVASLWSVDDKATSELMLAFYKNMASMNKREALRQAQIKTRENFPAPFYWAAFQLTGRAD